MNNFIKLTLRARIGAYHHSDPNANAETCLNIDRIDYYFEDLSDEYKSVVCINTKEFRCVETVEEIKEKLILAEIADNLA